MKTEDIASLIKTLRKEQGRTQAEFAKMLGTSQSAVTRMEAGRQNFSLEMLGRISEVLNKELISLSDGSTNFKIVGGNKLSGKIATNISKNATVGLLCASLLNRGTTKLKRVPKIEEVFRIIEVLQSIGVEVTWEKDDLIIRPPKRLRVEKMDRNAARQTRTIVMFLAPLMHLLHEFSIPAPGGCNLGSRTILPHIYALESFGLTISASRGLFQGHVKKRAPGEVIMYETGDSATENAIMAAALTPANTILKYAGANYMVQELCFFLQKCGVRIDGIGTSTLTVHGIRSIDQNITYAPSEDPIEAMTLIAAAIITDSKLTITRAPVAFLEKELFVLEKMGLKFKIDQTYKADNGTTMLADITIVPSELLASPVKLHALPYPGINMDNLPFLALIATKAKGRTLVHDWSYENRAIYFTELNKLDANVELADPHRVFITGPTNWKPADISSPQALRPSMMVFLAMLAAPGQSILRNVYSINRGYADLASRLNSVGANITTT